LIAGKLATAVVLDLGYDKLLVSGSHSSSVISNVMQTGFSPATKMPP
jgi:hypothetical protein